jgi:hypothetical protein
LAAASSTRFCEIADFASFFAMHPPPAKHLYAAIRFHGMVSNNNSVL